MEDVMKYLLVEQIKEKGLTVREMHAQIEKICENDRSRQWFSMSTLERRLQRPDDISPEELILIRDAVRGILSNAAWIHIKRNITEDLRQRYVSMIDEAVSKGFALHQQIADYDNTSDDDAFVRDVRIFYRHAPEKARERWMQVLPVYLRLPDIAKAAVMCGSYIGRSRTRNEAYESKTLQFIDYFPVFQGINIISMLTDDQISVLSGILKLASLPFDTAVLPDKYRVYAVDKAAIEIPSGFGQPAAGEQEFARLVQRYKHTITDFHVESGDLIRGLCFVLYLGRVDWLLAYTTSIFYYNLEETESRIYMRREYHERGCTGFRFTDKELDYLCELLYSLEN